MKKYILISLFLSTYFQTSNAFAQEVQFTTGKRFESANSTYINTDSIIFYEDNPNTEYYPLGVVYRTPIKSRFELSIGALYYKASTGYGAFEKNYCDECPGPVTKMTLVSHPTIEFPLLAVFKAFNYRNWELNAQAGITPAVRLRKKGYEHIADPPDFEPEIAEILNASPSTVKTAYVNYPMGYKSGTIVLGSRLSGSKI